MSAAWALIGVIILFPLCLWMAFLLNALSGHVTALTAMVALLRDRLDDLMESDE